MTEQLILRSQNLENEINVGSNLIPQKNGSMVAYGLLIFSQQAGKLKNDVSEKGAEISQRQDKIKLIHDVLQSINKLSNEKGLDLSDHPEVQEKLKVAKELGVDFDETRLKFEPEDRDFLKESLQLTEAEFINENKLQTQKMQMLIQEADRWLTLANTLMKNIERTTKSLIDKMK